MPNKQPVYKLYAIRTADIPQGALKGFQYSLQANGRYVLIFTDQTLDEPYRAIADGVKLEKDEQEWLIKCKTEINAKYMRENETEYAEVLNSFAEALEKELAEESKKVGEKEMKETDKRIFYLLESMKEMGFEVIKSNSGQIALNNRENTMPFVLTNDIYYLTPTPYQWYSIDDEIRRLRGK